MSAPDSLILKCAHEGRDSMEVDAEIDGYVCLTVSNASKDETHHYLSRETATDLVIWLGKWLHST